jgi:hypothetical protein
MVFRTILLVTMAGLIAASGPRPLCGEEPREGEKAGAGAERAPEILPATLALPPAGSYLAPKLLRMAGRLAGMPPRAATERINKIRVTISPSLAHRHVGLEELEFILAAHSIFLFPIDHPSAGRVLVAAERPDWEPPRARTTRVISVSPSAFERVWREIEEKVEAENRRLEPSGTRIAAVPSRRAGKIVLSCPSSEALDELEKLIAALDEPDSERPRLFSYEARFSKASELEPELVKRLSEAERARVRISVPSWGNYVLYRTQKALGEKVRTILEELDRPGGKGGKLP